MPNAKGLLILIQNGDYLFSPEMMPHLLYRTLNTAQILTNIDDIIYANANIAALMPGDRLRYQFFLHCFRNEDRRITKALIDNLDAAWRSELEGLIGTYIGIDYRGKDPRNFVESLRYFRGI